MNLTFSGKALLISITIVASAAGFSLGYFVGQSTAVSPAPALSGQQGGDLPAAPNAANTGADLKNETQPTDGPAERDLTAESKQASAIPASHNISQPLSATGKQDDKNAIVKPDAEQESVRAEALEQDSQSKKKFAYTVQAGSFRRHKDAEVLKQNLEAKGYKVSIKKEANPKGATYKVRVGEFEKKKEASVAAIKLNKTEGLNAFASLKR